MHEMTSDEVKENFNAVLNMVEAGATVKITHPTKGIRYMLPPSEYRWYQEQKKLQAVNGEAS